LTQNHLGVRSAKFQTRYGHIAALAAKKKAHADWAVATNFIAQQIWGDWTEAGLRPRRKLRVAPHNYFTLASAMQRWGKLLRLCGAGAPFRPCFVPVPSCSVPGPKNFLLRPH